MVVRVPSSCPNGIVASRLDRRRRALGARSVGITGNLQTRLEQHRIGLGSEFVKKYKVHRLVHVEPYENAEDAIRREKQLKKWNRDWKIRLIEEDNPEWADRTALLT